jgi:hypothetical protein
MEPVRIFLRNYGYPRHWSSSVRERLYAISFLVLMRNMWGKRLALRTSEQSIVSLPNLSCLWSHHLFPLSPRRLPFRVNPSPSCGRLLTRDTCVQSYGRIVQKVKLLKSLEQCRTNLVSKIMTKLSLLHSRENRSPSKRIPIPPDLQLLDHCQGFVLSQSSTRGSTQEGSLRKLREEAALAEEISQSSLKFQSQFVKYFDWIGAVDPPPPEAPLTTSSFPNSEISVRDLHEELVKSADMIASLESVLPMLLLYGKYCFVPSPSSSTSNGEESQRRLRVASSESCLQELTITAASQLEDLAVLVSYDVSDLSSPSPVAKIQETERADKSSHPSPPPLDPTPEDGKSLELSLTSLLSSQLPSAFHLSSEEESPHLSVQESGAGESLNRLRDNHRGVIQKTVLATQKFNCPYEFGSLPRR